ncbi:MAG: beta-galactosidase, partial [Armatimonadetes bacterium]|nr:beta-galactosidase [Armatimonadota bacterium]
YDYSAIDAKLRALLDVDPDVWFIITYDLSTRFQPWWIEAHPEALCRMESKDETIGDYMGSRRKVPSFASPTWREAFLDCQARLVRHLKESPFASRIIGYEPCNGITYEWFLWGAQSNELVDYSESGLADFRRWLKEKYKTDAALQAAWKNPDVTLAAAAIPTDKERRSPGSGMFFTPGAQQNVIDYNRHQHDQVVDTILYFAKGLKKESEGKGIVGTFYGYVSHLPDSPGFGQSSGHFQLSRILQEPDIDFLMSPTAYSWRELGGTSACMTAFGSLSLNNKLWFNQADTRTHWSHQDGFGRPTDLMGSIQMQRREEVLALTTGCVVQWFDFSTGWMWGDVRLAEDAKRLSAIDAACRNRKPLPRKDVLAVIVDDQQMGRSDLFKLPYSDQLIYRQRNFLHQCGVPWRMYLFSDLVRHPELKEHRAFLFLNLFNVDEAKRKVVEDLKSNGRVLAFVGPAGFVGDGFSVERASKLIGINLRQLDTASAADLTCHISNPDSPLAKGLTKESIYGVALKPEPAFAISDASAEIIGSYDGAALSCLAMRRYPKWTSVASLAPGLPPEILRGIGRMAGLHVYSEANEPIFIGYGLVAVHAASSGEKVFQLPATGKVKEWFSGTTMQGKVSEIRLKMKAGETVLFQVD